MSEFDVIKKYFLPLTMGQEDLLDDCAVVRVADGDELLVSTDTLNGGVHFFEGAAPEIIAQKCLRVNLSDLAASGARPLCYQMAIGFPDTPDEAWLAAFSGALLADQERYGIYCSGGDTTSIKGGLSVTITAMGVVPAGGAVRRSGAKSGDVAIVTGVIGRGYAAFTAGDTYAADPRCVAVDVVREYASACVDVSDGLIADAWHITRASGVDLVLRLGDVPVVGKPLEAITGGDDYELVLAVSADRAGACLDALREDGLQPAVIGRFEDGVGCVKVLGDDGDEISIDRGGWQHF